MIKKILHLRFLLITFKLDFLHLLFVYDVSFKNPSFFSYFYHIMKFFYHFMEQLIIFGIKIKRSSAYFCNFFVLISSKNPSFFGKKLL